MSTPVRTITNNGQYVGKTNLDVPGTGSGLEPSRPVVALSLAAGLLGGVAAAVGLLAAGNGPPVAITTFLGEDVVLYGRGLYEHDTLFYAANNFATDLVMLFLAVPLLAISLRMYLKSSLRGRLLLLGGLGFFLYYGTTYALGGVAYNELFLVYVALFSSSLFAFIALFASFNAAVLARFSGRMPRRLPGIFMMASAVTTFAIWMLEPVGSLLTGEPPGGLETHTTLFTHALDLGVIVPAASIAGVLILRRRTFGYVVASSLIVLEAFLLPIITIATVLQLDLGITFEPAEIVGPIAGFGLLAGFSLWVIAVILYSLPSTHPSR